MKGLIPWRKKSEDVMESRHEDSSFDLMERTMEHLFEDVDWGLTRGALLRRDEPWAAGFPSFEMSEDDAECCIKAELPGMDEKDIEVRVDGRELTIRGEKRREHEEKRRDYFVSEVSYGEFSRSILLPEGVDRDNVKAIFKKGVLTLTLPKTEEGKSLHKRITVIAA